MEWFAFFEKGIWFGCAAMGFGILFNVPPRTLFIIWILAATGGLLKLLLVHFGYNVILASLAGSTLIGVTSVWAAHNKHAPPLVFAIPSVIPLVPGVFAYKMMLGFIKLAGSTLVENYNQILAETVNNSLKMLFILMSLAVGVAFPTLISRKSSIKYMNFFKRKNEAEKESAIS
jgi:uncharacterized membrane protein YjjB (DUF3815 family)